MFDVPGPRFAATLSPDEVICPDSLGASLLQVAARATHGRSGEDLRRVPILGRRGVAPAALRHQAVADDAGGQAVQGAASGRINADVVADWITEHYPAVDYPAVVLGSPHGAAVHLAAALGAPWLPTGFAVTVQWPGGAVGDWPGAAAFGAVVADRILAANPSVTVRQIHDPVSRGPVCGTTVTLQLCWRGLPEAYRAFLRSRLRSGGASLLIRDTRTWPVLDLTPGHTFQIGSPTTGWRVGDYTDDNPAFRRLMENIGMPTRFAPYPTASVHYAETGGDPRCEPALRRLAAEHGHASHRILYHGPEALSACVADMYRDLLRRRFDGGERCVVETGSLLDPGKVLADGLVPYWCESATRPAVTAAEWWLAGSGGFDAVTVLPQPPGVDCAAYATLDQWHSVSRFARQRADVDRLASNRYPLLPLPTSHTAGVLSRSSPAGSPPAGIAPAAISVADAMAAFTRSSAAGDMLVL